MIVCVQHKNNKGTIEQELGIVAGERMGELEKDQSRRADTPRLCS